MKVILILVTALALASLPWLHAADSQSVIANQAPKAEVVKSVRLILPAQPGLVVEHIGQVLARQIQQRCEAKVVRDGEAPLTVELAVGPGIGAEGYRIEDCPGGGVRIVGNDAGGVLYAAGKFLRTSRYDQGGFTPGAWRGTSVPQKPQRGIYFATHSPRPGNPGAGGNFTCGRCSTRNLRPLAASPMPVATRPSPN